MRRSEDSNNMSNLLQLVKDSQLRDNLPRMRPGDTVRVHTIIREGNKDRIQVFEGLIIALHNAENASTVTVRKISHNSIGVERTFMVHSPRVDHFEIIRRGRVRRAKLYFLRDRQGKSARIKELRGPRGVIEKVIPRVEAVAVEPEYIEPIEAPAEVLEAVASGASEE